MAEPQRPQRSVPRTNKCAFGSRPLLPRGRKLELRSSCACARFHNPGSTIPGKPPGRHSPPARNSEHAPALQQLSHTRGAQAPPLRAGMPSLFNCFAIPEKLSPASQLARRRASVLLSRERLSRGSGRPREIVPALPSAKRAREQHLTPVG